MSYRKLGDICEQIKNNNNIKDIYQPLVIDNLLYFEKIAESNRISDILFNKVGKDNRTITVYSKTYNKDSINSKQIDIVKLEVTETDQKEVLVFSFISNSNIDFYSGNEGKYIIEEEFQNGIRKLLREYPFYPGNDKIVNLMLRIYIE